jgi:hypothetical protein
MLDEKEINQMEEEHAQAPIYAYFKKPLQKTLQSVCIPNQTMKQLQMLPTFYSEKEQKHP